MRGDLKSERERYERELPQRIEAVFASHPTLYDHRSQFPGVLACLGDPSAPVWFVAENPSRTQVERAVSSSPEDQWNVSVGDKLFRQQLVSHGFKTGTADSPGGWRCYITDVVKSVDRVNAWSKLPESERRRVAELWAPVLAWELELGQPKIVVSVGASAGGLLDHLLHRRLIPALPLRKKVHHYAYIGSYPDSRTRLGRGHPDRVAAWSDQFAAVRAALDGGVAPPTTPASLSRPPGAASAGRAPRRAHTSDPIDAPELVRDGIRSGLTPDQICDRSGKRRIVWLAGIVEEARQRGELAAFRPTAGSVAKLRDTHAHRWERIAVRVFGDPRRTREAMDLYDQAKGRPGAAQESYTGRGRRFPKMKP